MNQFTEQFSVLELAQKVQRASDRLGLYGGIEHTPNPRVESESHRYNAAHSHLTALGLRPHLLTADVLEEMLGRVFDTVARL